MIPIGDNNPRARQQAVVVPLLANICVAISIVQFIFQDAVTYAWSATAFELLHAMDLDHPVRLLTAQGLVVVPHQALPHPALIYLTPFTAMFLHGDIWHLLGNLLYLWIFGNQIEQLLGRLRFLIFYLLTGLLATLVHLGSDPDSMIPMLGASGAISGVLGAYFRRFPWNLITFWLFPLPLFIPVPALLALGFWFLGQWTALTQAQPGVAWLAHIGGFVAGMLLINVFDTRQRRQRR